MDALSPWPVNCTVSFAMKTSFPFSRRQFLKAAGQTAAVLSFSQLTRAEVAGLHPELKRLGDLLVAAGGELILPLTEQGEASQVYESMKTGFNLRFAPSPKGIALPINEAVLPKIIEWSQKTGIPLHLRSGGHSFEGHSTGPGIILDLRRMNRIQIDKASKTARIQTGCRLFQVAKTLSEQGLMLPAGTCPTVGIAGVTLGGGIGMSSRRYGLTCDQIQSLTAITADGRVLKVTDREEADLFWACRGGGGGNFALISEIEFKVQAVDEVIFFQYRFAAQDAEGVFEQWQETAPHISRDITANLSLAGSPESGMGVVKITGQSLARNSTGQLSPKKISAALEPTLRRFKTVKEPTVAVKSYLKAVVIFAGGETEDPVRFKAGSDIAMEKLSSRGIQTLVQEMGKVTSGTVTVIFDSWRGAIADVKPADSAFPHREALFGVQYYSQWTRQREDTARIEAVRQVQAAMKPYFSGRHYVNYIDRGVTNAEAAYFADNAARLREIKRAYDPNGFFKNGI